jgi:hypothetical protein
VNATVVRRKSTQSREKGKDLEITMGEIHEMQKNTISSPTTGIVLCFFAGLFSF